MSDLDKALAALKEISKREGTFRRDELEWAKNVIDNMESIAVKALDEIRPDWREEQG